MEVLIKTFSKLTNQELYDLLQLRSEVFVVEQECVYQDIDGKDQDALHVLGYHEQKLIAYTRVFKPGDYFKESSIGRVVVKQESRGLGDGYEIMKSSISYIGNVLNESVIRISAQTYLKQFYSNLGFNEVGRVYLEDGIPHINMVRNQINLKFQ